MKKVLKWFLWILAAGGLILVLCGLYIGGLNYEGYFHSAKGNLTEARIASFGSDSIFNRNWLYLGNDRGLRVECGLLLPVNETPGRRYPVVIVMGGKATGKHAIDYAVDIRNAIIAAPDYPYTPRDSYTLSEFLGDVPEMRRAALGMVPSVMLLTDYLWKRQDVDTTRLIFLGYSFGAPFVCCIVTHDRRAAAAAMVFGGGDLYGMIRHNVRRYRGPVVSEFVGLVGTILLRPLEPMRYVGRVSPIPLVMINGSEDRQIPPKYAKMLFDEARQPKSMVWLEAKHVNPKNVELTGLIVATLKAELVKIRLLTKEN